MPDQLRNHLCIETFSISKSPIRFFMFFTELLSAKSSYCFSDRLLKMEDDENSTDQENKKADKAVPTPENSESSANDLNDGKGSLGPTGETKLDDDEKEVRIAEETEVDSEAIGNGKETCFNSDERGTSHSEDKIVLFDPQSYIHEMELNSENKFDVSTNKNECSPSCIQKRNLIALLSFFGFFNVYCLRVDLSITLVAMTNKHIRMNLLGEEYMVSH